MFLSNAYMQKSWIKTAAANLWKISAIQITAVHVQLDLIAP